MACQVLSFINAWVFSYARDTFLVPWYMKRVFNECWQLRAPHVQWCDGDFDGWDFLTFMGGKTRTVIFNGRYKFPFERTCLFIFALKNSCAYILSSVKLPAKLKFLSSIKSLSEELFLISVSFLRSSICAFPLLGLSFFCSSPSFDILWVFLVVSRDG